MVFFVYLGLIFENLRSTDITVLFVYDELNILQLMLVFICSSNTSYASANAD